MQILQSILLGILQGVTEWLPISSSGHLAIAQHFFSIQTPLFFDILLHLATVLVIIIFFRKEIIKISPQTLTYLTIATIPIAIIGYFFQTEIEALFTNITAIAISFIIFSLFLFLSEKYPKENKITWKESIIIGLSQALAIIPGISRSGSTISTGLLLGIKKEDAITFSFLLAIPAILGATILHLPQATFEISYLFGFFIAIIASYFTLFLLTKIIKNNKFHYFGYYCLTLGIILLLTQT
jgi:undecaprenyl-diphosphatase